MARTKASRLVTRDVYDNIGLAIKELGTLWVLDRINSGLAYNRKRKEEMREMREQRAHRKSPTIEVIK
jgi:hypothetical protein